jgi:hypothetical protein
MAEADKPLVEVQQGTSSLIPAECLALDQSDGESRPLPICNVVAPVPVAEQRKAKAKEIGQNLQKVLNKPKAGAPVADVLADLKAKLGGKAEKKDAVAPAPKPASKAKAKSAAKAKPPKKRLHLFQSQSRRSRRPRKTKVPSAPAKGRQKKSRMLTLLSPRSLCLPGSIARRLWPKGFLRIPRKDSAAGLIIWSTSSSGRRTARRK